MSLLTRFKGKKSRDIDDLRNDIIENLSGIISSRAPIFFENLDNFDNLRGTIVECGIRNNTRFQKKYNGKFLFEEILELIAKFEPRLQNVTLQQTSDEQNSNILEFRIYGTIVFDGVEDNLQLDSYLDFGASVFNVRKINFV